MGRRNSKSLETEGRRIFCSSQDVRRYKKMGRVIPRGTEGPSFPEEIPLLRAIVLNRVVPCEQRALSFLNKRTIRASKVRAAAALPPAASFTVLLLSVDKRAREDQVLHRSLLFRDGEEPSSRKGLAAGRRGKLQKRAARVSQEELRRAG